MRFEYMDTISCKWFKDLFEYAYVVSESGILLNQYLCKTGKLKFWSCVYSDFYNNYLGITEYKTEQHSALVREFLLKHKDN